jgi:cytochrome c553
MLSPILIASLEKLPDKLQQEVLHYAEFLAANYTQNNLQSPKQKRRQAGTMQGMFDMSDDFDAPLADLQEYM